MDFSVDNLLYNENREMSSESSVPRELTEQEKLDRKNLPIMVE